MLTKGEGEQEAGPLPDRAGGEAGGHGRRPRRSVRHHQEGDLPLGAHLCVPTFLRVFLTLWGGLVRKRGNLSRLTTDAVPFILCTGGEAHNKVPVAFGIFKLLISMVVFDDEVRVLLSCVCLDVDGSCPLPFNPTAIVHLPAH